MGKCQKWQPNHQPVVFVPNYHYSPLDCDQTSPQWLRLSPARSSKHIFRGTLCGRLGLPLVSEKVPSYLGVSQKPRIAQDH